ncbi:MAG: hypothetical protein JSS00_05015 [Proteobacteria bacterium]|nr:hypothetical protein [Pseudomonadota bacterium]
MNEDPHKQAQHFIKQAQRAAKRGDHAGAERWTRTAERFALAAQRIQDRLPLSSEEEDEALVTELLARLEHYAAADREIQAWDREKEVHDALTEQAQRHNLPLPPPLRPCPVNENDLIRIATEGLSNVVSAR